MKLPGSLGCQQSTIKMLYLGITLALLVGLGGGLLVGRQTSRFALRDPLTGLPNKPAFNQELESLAANTNSAAPPLAILFIDIDQFKQVNDSYSHLAGDEVLRQLGTVLKSICPVQKIFRWGGDEFTILTTGNRESVQKYAKKIQQAITELVTTYQQQSIRISVSIGLAQQLPSEDGSKLLSRADQALYQAKNNGRNQICWSDSTL